METGRPPDSGRSHAERGRLRSRPPLTSDVEPPPSRFIAALQPSETISSASSSSVSPESWRERPSQATANIRPSARPSAARGWRPSVMSESNCDSPALKPSASSRAREDDRAVAHQQRPRLQQVARRLRGDLAARPDRRDAAAHVHARAHAVPRRVERHETARDAARAHLTEREPVRPHEEAADERLVVAAGGAPRLQARLGAQHRDAQLGRRGVVAGDVHHRPGAVGQLDARAAHPAWRGGLSGSAEANAMGHRIVAIHAKVVNRPLA